MIVIKEYCDRCGKLVEPDGGATKMISIDKGLHQKYFLCNNCINEYEDLVASTGINFINNKAVHEMAVMNWGNRIYNETVKFADLPLSEAMKIEIIKYLEGKKKD